MPQRARKLRVLHVGKFFPPDLGGIETFLADLVHAQRRQGIEAFALVHGEPRPDDPAWLRRVPVQLRLVFAPIALGFPAALRNAIRDLRPDTLHIHMPNLSALWVLVEPSARAIPWVVHWHADVLASKLHGGLARAYRFYRPFERALLDRTERIIATSPPYLESSESLAPWRFKSTVVPLGIDLERLPRPQPARQPPAHRETGPFRILSIGRLTYYKGYETLIDAVAGIDGTRLEIIGEGEESARLQARVDRLEPSARQRIKLLGRVPEHQKFALLAGCDLFCLASRERTEAFGMAVLEAMSQGKPCLVSDLPGSGMPWLVGSSQAGQLVRLEDVDHWRESILALMTDRPRAEEFGRSGLGALRTRFSIDSVAAQLTRAYPAEAAPKAQSDRILIVIPARDEETSIGGVVERLQAAGWHDVLVIDDRSSDATARIASKSGARLLCPALRLGAWGAMQAGIRFARRNGYGGVITMDADGQHEVAEIPSLLHARSGADVVIGACPERGSLLRRFAWAWFRRIAGFSLADLTSGFRYYNAAAIDLLAGSEATLLDYQDVGVLLLVRRAGLRIAEVPVSMNLRQAGKSRIFHSWFAVAFYMAETTLLCLARWHRGARHARS